MYMPLNVYLKRLAEPYGKLTVNYLALICKKNYFIKFPSLLFQHFLLLPYYFIIP